MHFVAATVSIATETNVDIHAILFLFPYLIFWSIFRGSWWLVWHWSIWNAHAWHDRLACHHQPIRIIGFAIILVRLLWTGRFSLYWIFSIYFVLICELHIQYINWRQIFNAYLLSLSFNFVSQITWVLYSLLYITTYEVILRIFPWFDAYLRSWSFSDSWNPELLLTIITIITKLILQVNFDLS